MRKQRACIHPCAHCRRSKQHVVLGTLPQKRDFPNSRGGRETENFGRIFFFETDPMVVRDDVTVKWDAYLDMYVTPVFVGLYKKHNSGGGSRTQLTTLTRPPPPSSYSNSTHPPLELREKSKNRVFAGRSGLICGSMGSTAMLGRLDPLWTKMDPPPAGQTRFFAKKSNFR